MAHRNRFAAATALAAAFSLAATPALAHDHHWHRWHRDRIDGGDVLAGALIIGGIAAIATAANKADRDDREPAAPPVPQDRQGYGYRGADRDVGLDHAANMCAEAAEHGPNRVGTIDNVARDRDGWSVSGALTSGAGFTCRIGNDGQVQGVNLAAAPAGGPAAQSDEGDEAHVQPDHETPPPAVDNRPVWHGDNPTPQQQDDGRYDTSSAPDSGQSA